eukprot:maker-scaffold_4-snap-gene-17.58-mRNA-1 protein AED:0.01 eAED:0.01 QI:58/1/1/1/1/1/3/160/317
MSQDSAEHYIQEAQEAIKTSLFKWTPDYLTAGMYLEKAAHAYELALNTTLAIKYYLEAASCQEKADLPLSAAKSLEKYITLSFANETSMSEENIAQTFHQIKRMETFYNSEGNTSQLLSSLENISKSILQSSCFQNKTLNPLLVNKVHDIFQSCLKKLPKLQKKAFHLQILNQALVFYIVTKEYSEAMSVLQLSVDIYKNLGLDGKVHLSYLSLVILCVERNDYVAAESFFNKGINEKGFLNSSECTAAEKYLRSVKNGDDEILGEVHKMPVLSSLNKQVEKLIRQRKVQVESRNEPGSVLSPQKVAANEEDLGFLC